jgi:two-component system NtrC family response regulator
LKIAIVEDDINMRKSLEISMSDYKEFEIKTFKNAKDALKAIDSSYNLIITDINMPKMDGIEFIKELNGAFDVIIMTGNATLSRAIESIHLGVKDFLIKPFDIDTLVEAIRRESVVQKVVASSHKKSSSKKRVKSDFLGTSSALKVCINFAIRGEWCW